MKNQKYKVVPHPKLKRDYRGRVVRLTRNMANGFGKLPAGAVGIIEAQNNKGSEFLGEPCEYCGVCMRVSRLSVSDIEFLESIQTKSEVVFEFDVRWAERGGILYDFIRERLCLGLFAMGNYSVSSELLVIILSGQDKGGITNVRKSDLRMANEFECSQERIDFIESPLNTQDKQNIIEVIDDLASWSGYASDYFKEKHRLQESLDDAERVKLLLRKGQ